MRLKPHQVEPGDTEGYILTTVGGIPQWAPPATPPPPQLLALTTSINGVPDFVWDADNQLVYTEVPA